MSDFPNTGTLFQEQRTNSGLSTQIIIKVNDEPVGALQRISVSQNRPLKQISEVGTDGLIEIVPQGATTFTLDVERMVFDQLRLPEAFSRGFRFINAQRNPFDIEIFDLSSVDPSGAAPTSSNGLVVMTFKNCWFASYSTPYQAGDYTIAESAQIQAETAFVSNLEASQSIFDTSRRGLAPQTDEAGIEDATNLGGRRGALDASGLINSLFG